MKRFALAVLVLVGSQCCPHQNAVPLLPTPPPPPQTATCDSVCENYRRLDCPAGRPTPAGKPCEAVCLNAMTAGLDRWNLACRSHAVSCSAADACEHP